jgi:hypothetical protein
MKLEEILKKYFEEHMSSEALGEINTLFEATVAEAVKASVKEATKTKETELEEKYSDELAEFKSDLIDKLNSYVSLCVEDFITENKPLIQSEIKVEMAAKVMEGLSAVLKDQHVEIKEEDVDVVKDLETKNTELTTKLNDSINEGIESKKQTIEYQKAMKFKELTETLVDTDAERVLDLMENVSADDIATFEAKLKTVLTKMVAPPASDDDEPKGEDLKEEIIDPNKADDNSVNKYAPKKYSY